MEQLILIKVKDWKDMNLRFKETQDKMNEIVDLLNEALYTDTTCPRYAMIKQDLHRDIKQYGSSKKYPLKRVGDSSQKIDIDGEVADGRERVRVRANAATDGAIDMSKDGFENKDLDNVDDSSTYKRFTATEQTKLTGIEGGADVTGDHQADVDIDNITDGSTYKKCTANQQTGAGYAYDRLDSNGIKAATIISGKPDDMGTLYEKLDTSNDSWAKDMETYLSALNTQVQAAGGGDSGAPPTPPLDEV